MLLVDPLDSGIGAAIESNAESKGVKVIDYDRLVTGGPADRYYVSFDNVKVGKLIGQGEVDCISAWNVKKPNILIMDGDPTDNNAQAVRPGLQRRAGAELRRRDVRQGRRAGRDVGSAHGGDHVRAAVHRPPEHQRGRHAERRQRQRGHRACCRRTRFRRRRSRPPVRTPRRRGCRTSSRATSAARSTSRSTWRPRRRPRSPCTSGPASRRRRRWSTRRRRTPRPAHDIASVLRQADLGHHRQHGRHRRQGRRGQGRPTSVPVTGERVRRGRDQLAGLAGSHPLRGCGPGGLRKAPCS